MRPSCDLNEKHTADPRPGDYWHEMFCPVCVVVGMVAGHVIICKTSKDTGPKHWTWDLMKLDLLSKADFRKFLKSPCDKYWWADVFPECHTFVTKALEEMASTPTSGDRTTSPPDGEVA